MNEILLAREKRSEHIKQLIDSNEGKTLAVLKLNVVGEEKNPKYMKFICMLFNKYMQDEFGRKIEIFEKVISMDGDYIYYIIDEKPSIVKERTIYIEDHNYFGRLVDIDVYKEHSISRSDLKCKMRKCLICDNFAHICSRNQTHSKTDIHNKVREMIDETLPKIILNEVISLIHYELEMYPRFGLVSKMNNGIHSDMDYDLFIDSTHAIKPYLEQFIKMGLNEIEPLKLQSIGKEAEKAMFTKTKNVNTQKGLIFALGVFLPAFVHSIIKNQDEKYLKQQIINISHEIIGDYYKDISNKSELSHGDEIYLKTGIKGIRGEALNGFKLLFDEVPNTTGKYTDPFEYLLYFMSQLDDTTIIHRKGLEGLRNVQHEVTQLINKGGYSKNQQEYYNLSQQYCKNGISPGGSSDLLVLKLLYESLKYLMKNIDL